MSSTVHEHALAEVLPQIRFSKNVARFDFMSCLLPGLFEQKIAALVDDLDAELRSATLDRVKLRVGRRKSVLPFVKQGDDFPVAVTLTVNRDAPCAKSMTHVAVEIRPLVRASKAAFERRAAGMVKEINSCLLGHELELV